MALRPSMPFPAAITRAVWAHAHSSDMTPEAAAAFDATVSTWRLPRTPMRPPDTSMSMWFDIGTTQDGGRREEGPK